MPEGHILLLANFYGSYLDKSIFDEAVVVNNAGIEQLASLGVDKLKQLKLRHPAQDQFFVVIVAGLTDVIIKSVEQNKNKLEITPNSAQLLETKVEWAHKLLVDAGAKVFWAVMPPISLRMYHQTEGWNINQIPGMSAGLDREQVQLNQLMLSYRNLAFTLNQRGSKKVYVGLFFTDMVAEVSADKRSIKLNTSYFDSDGISPSKTLVDDWNRQLAKLAKAVSSYCRTAKRVNNPSDSWALPPPTKRAAGDGHDSLRHSTEGLPPPRDVSRAYDDRSRDHGRPMDRDYRFGETNDRKRYRESSPSRGGIPSLMDIESQRSNQNGLQRPAESASSTESDRPLSTAMQLLAATLQMGGSNTGNVQAMLNMMLSQQKKEEEEKRKEEERRAELRRRSEEEDRLLAIQRRMEEERKKEEMRRLDEERRRKQEEENRLREIQLAAQRAIEIQQREQQEKLDALKRQLVQAQIAAEQKAHMERMAAATSHSSSSDPFKSAVTPLLTSNTRPRPSALERINEKLMQDRLKRDKAPAAPESRPLQLLRNPAWQQPVVLFSFVNRASQRKPLRGISGVRNPTRSAESDHRSRNQQIYRPITGPSPIAGFLKLTVRRPGDMNEFECKVASYNNKLLDLINESRSLIAEGKRKGYKVYADADDDAPKQESSSASRTPDPKKRSSPSSNKKDSKNVSSVSTVGQRSRSLERKAPAKQASEASKSNSNVKERSSSTPRETKRKESSLPPAQLPKPRWDNSDDSEEELLWDEDVEHNKVLDDDDGKSVASTREDTGTSDANADSHVGNKPKANPVANKDVMKSETVEKMEDGAEDQDQSEAVATNVASSPTQEKSDDRSDEPDKPSFVTVDEEGFGDDNASAEKGDNQDDNADAVDDFVTIDETS